MNVERCLKRIVEEDSLEMLKVKIMFVYSTYYIKR